MNQTPDATLLAELSAIVDRVKTNEPLSRHSTFGIGGPADFYVEVKTEKQMRDLWRWVREKNLPLFPIGQGSNLLISDKGIRGVVVRLKGELEEIVFDGETVRVGAGIMWPVLAKRCAEEGLSGVEPLVGVPGTVGGGLMSNAGTPEGDTGSLVESVDVLNPSGEVETVLRKDIDFRYRFSSLAGRFVLRAKLKLRRENKNVIIPRIQQQLDRRAKNQPLGTHNVGSIFKNPPGDHAARLVEDCGLKGYRIGGAQVSPKHANFIVNVENAKAQDVLDLVALIRKTVKEKHGVELDLEMVFVGEK